MAKWTVGEPLTLRTKRFTLRSLQREDVTEAVYGWLTDRELMHNLGGGWKAADIEALRDSIEKLYDNKGNFLLGVYDGERPIGCYWIDVSRHNRTACTHHVLGERSYWGKGVPMECRAVILDWLFAIGTERVEGRPYTTCIAAIKGYLKQGWHLEGIARRATRDRDGRRHDNMLFSLLPEEWAAQRQLGPHGVAPAPAASGPAAPREG